MVERTMLTGKASGVAIGSHEVGRCKNSWQIVEFFLRERVLLGCKATLVQQIHEYTGIPAIVLRSKSVVNGRSVVDSKPVEDFRIEEYREVSDEEGLSNTVLARVPRSALLSKVVSASKPGDTFRGYRCSSTISSYLEPSGRKREMI